MCTSYNHPKTQSFELLKQNSGSGALAPHFDKKGLIREVHKKHRNACIPSFHSSLHRNVSQRRNSADTNHRLDCFGTLNNLQLSPSTGRIALLSQRSQLSSRSRQGFHMAGLACYPSFRSKIWACNQKQKGPSLTFCSDMAQSQYCTLCIPH